MGITIGNGEIERDWGAIASATAESVVQTVLLGEDGFSGTISALFRAVDGLRGNDSIELRATTLVMETLGYALGVILSSDRLIRKPSQPEAAELVRSLLARATRLATQQEVKFQPEHLANPASFSLFDDARRELPHTLKTFNPTGEELDISAKFQDAIREGVNHIRTRRPEYFAPVISALEGNDVLADAQSRAWAQYRSLLLRRFEDAVLFGEDENSGTTLGQVYQPVRAWWQEELAERVDADNETIIAGEPKDYQGPVNVDDLETIILNWLRLGSKTDTARLISGGPGSGKSTFAKRLASRLALQRGIRVIFVPLQRLKGTGPLENRINDYFRNEYEEPFKGEVLPLGSLGQDGHRDWLIIFDGLDELAKEGALSESAAQDFASALADWRGRIGTMAHVRFLVLGRAPSMQEARRRLGLTGQGTLHVANMLPIKDQLPRLPHGQEREIKGPVDLISKDQRPEFWSRWAAAKQISKDLPEAIQAKELSDLTKEPLLAHLLIMSGYVSEKWREAADNRNRVYEAIFAKIWDRERKKPTRAHLNDLGREGFDAIMQSLGLAAWRGGGRTGDELTFTEVRDAFMRSDLLAKAKACGAADLNNVALLFYTRRDEEGGRGYEFLHKSFGEYLTARGLFSAFLRWGTQVANPELDFGVKEFLKRWLILTGDAPITTEILSFLRNEVRLQASDRRGDTWRTAREWVKIMELLVDGAVTDGLPAHQEARSWRQAEKRQTNAETSLMALLDSCARSAFPTDLFQRDEAEGGWTVGPVKIACYQSDHNALKQQVIRLTPVETHGWMMGRSSQSLIPTNPRDGVILQLLSRLDLPRVRLDFTRLNFADLEGANLKDAYMIGVHFAGANLTSACLHNAWGEAGVFVAARFDKADLSSSRFPFADFEDAELVGATLTEAILVSAQFRDTNFTRANLREANLEGADCHNSNFKHANLEGMKFKNGDLRSAILEGTILEGERVRNSFSKRARRSRG